MGVEGIDEYAEKVIRIRARQLVRKAGFSESDCEDLLQDMKFDLWRRLSKFDPSKAPHSKAPRKAFIDRVVRHKVASILEGRKAQLRDYRRERGSLNDLLGTPDGKPAERGDSVDQNEACRRTGGPGRSAEDLRDLAIDIAAVVSNLPLELRDLCQLLMTETPTEVSRETSTAPGTLYDARRKIRRRFEDAKLGEYLPTARRFARRSGR